MTAAGVQRPPQAAPTKSRGPVLAGLRLTWLYLASRRVPAALGLLAGLSVLLWAALHWRWNIAGGAAAQQFIPLTIESGAAAVIAVTTYGPFGEQEKPTGRWLPWLRLGAVVLITAAALGLLAAGATGGQIPGGSLALLRNVTGITGIGLLCATALGGAFGWTGPLAYLLITEGAFAGSWTTPWDWPTRPSHDLGGALCACGVFAAGVVAITIIGTRGSSRLSSPE
jgi:hypothetical protein